MLVTGQNFGVIIAGWLAIQKPKKFYRNTKTTLNFPFFLLSSCLNSCHPLLAATCRLLAYCLLPAGCSQPYAASTACLPASCLHAAYLVHACLLPAIPCLPPTSYLPASIAVCLRASRIQRSLLRTCSIMRHACWQPAAFRHA